MVGLPPKPPADSVTSSLISKSEEKEVVVIPQKIWVKITISVYLLHNPSTRDWFQTVLPRVVTKPPAKFHQNLSATLIFVCAHIQMQIIQTIQTYMMMLMCHISHISRRLTVCINHCRTKTGWWSQCFSRSASPEWNMKKSSSDVTKYVTLSVCVHSLLLTFLQLDRRVTKWDQWAQLNPYNS